MHNTNKMNGRPASNPAAADQCGQLSGQVSISCLPVKPSICSSASLWCFKIVSKAMEQFSTHFGRIEIAFVAFGIINTPPPTFFMLCGSDCHSFYNIWLSLLMPFSQILISKIVFPSRAITSMVCQLLVGFPLIQRLAEKGLRNWPDLMVRENRVPQSITAPNNFY